MSDLPVLLDIVHTSPVVSAGLARHVTADGTVRLGLVAHSWTEFVHQWDFSASWVLVDAYLDDHVPLALKVRALRDIGSAAIVIGTQAGDAVSQRARTNGATAWIEPTSSLAETARRVAQIATTLPSTLPEAPESLGESGPWLTDREIQILCLFASRRAFDPAALARMLGVQRETVRTHLRGGRRKFAERGLAVHNRELLAAQLRSHGYLIADDVWRREGRW